MKIENNKDTIIAPISATIGGSVSLIRISGDQAISITNRYFNGIDLFVQKGGRFFNGLFSDNKNEAIDDVIILLYRCPNSYTGEDVIEISCHGNPFVVEQIIQQYLFAGCRMANPGEFSKRAFLNGKIDLLQAEAVADMIAAKSQKSAKNSLLHIEGVLPNLIIQLREELVKTTSLLILDLDFSEEELDIISRDQIAETIINSQKTINALINSYQYGRILSKGIEVLICGKPNVGKSSLMNALIKRDRVIVSSTPGTTRDTIHEDVVINNISIRFIDTAGIRLTNDQVESEGVNRSEAALDKADIILLVLDISEELNEEDFVLIKRLAQAYKNSLIVVGNKNDKKINATSHKEFDSLDLPAIKLSAKTGDYVDQLHDKIIDKLKANNDTLNEDILITNQRQFEILNKTNKALAEALEGVQNNLGFEFVVVDMKNAIDLLSEITGEISTDDILNNIFSNFCIGK